jgi:hypothetical protein
MPAFAPDFRLLFVYNADGGLLNAFRDAAHKLASPETYPCSLCATTYGAVAMRPEWRDYVARLPCPAAFFHRDEFRRAWPNCDEALPAVFIQHGKNRPQLLVRAEELPLGQSLEELMALLDGRLADQPGQAV